MSSSMHAAAAFVFVLIGGLGVSQAQGQPASVEEGLTQLLAGKLDQQRLWISYSDMHGLHGGLRMSIDGSGRVAQKAVRTQAGHPRLVNAAGSKRLAKLLLELKVWEQRAPARDPVPDESRATLQVRVGGQTVEVWEWFNDLGKNARLIRVRKLMQEVGWAKPGTFPSDADYKALTTKILARVLKSLPADGLPKIEVEADGSARLHVESGVTYERVEIPKGKKGSPRRPVYAEDGMQITLTAYRGQWEGAAAFAPIEFGDLKLWFSYGRGKKDAHVPRVTLILKEEKVAFDKRYPGLSHPWRH